MNDEMPDDLFGSDADDDRVPFDQGGPDLFGTEPDELFVTHEPTPVAQSEIDVDLDEMAEIPIDPDDPDAGGVDEDAPIDSLLPPSRDRAMTPVARPDAPLALYRRYRPDTFADVIGQDHVTEPLQRALVNNRVNHAYLFSGPRGCGKTTSARILARCLNCEQGPTPTPCGECQSCRDLARGGLGSIDVIEIDAASHGGVNEARDLRERAFFAPVHSRYKIYIIDEAHMVTKEGFNALLKLVEEPPPHVKFIFATTEPEKVLGTIKSRTHHYPFRLVPPKVLAGYLEMLCTSEGVGVDRAVLPLVVRAGAGSVRDSLSVLDQLLGGAGESGVTYTQATALLGYTPDTLLDEIMDAFAAGDAAGVFACVDKVIEVGQDPRRFAEDLLRRLRDLIIVAAVPDALTSGLVSVAADQAERLTTQARGLGAGELTRAAEVIAKGLTDMRGTTAPRLHLELMCARVLLPGADADDRGVHARLDRLERRLSMVGDAPAESPVASGTHPAAAELRRPAPAAAATMPPDAEGAARVSDRPQQPGGRGGQRATDGHPAQASASEAEHGSTGRPLASDPWAEPATSTGGLTPAAEAAATAAPDAATAPDAESGPAAAAPGASPSAPQASRGPAVRSEQGDPGSLTTADVRRMWPQVLEAVKQRRRVTWIVLSQNAQVHDHAGGVLTVALNSAGARESFGRGGSPDILREALIEVLGIAPTIETIVAGGGPTPPPPGRPPLGPRDQGPKDAGPREPAPPTTPPRGPDSTPGTPEPDTERGPARVASDRVRRPQAPSARTPEPPPDDDEPPVDRPSFASLARERIRPTQVGAAPAADEVEQGRDDTDLDSSDVGVEELLAKELGAELIFEDPAGS